MLPLYCRERNGCGVADYFEMIRQHRKIPCTRKIRRKTNKIPGRLLIYRGMLMRLPRTEKKLSWPENFTGCALKEVHGRKANCMNFCQVTTGRSLKTKQILLNLLRTRSSPNLLKSSWKNCGASSGLNLSTGLTRLSYSARFRQNT